MSLTTDDIVEALSSNLDPAYAAMLVEREAHERCLAGDLSLDAALTILRSLERRGGAAGMAARLASLMLTRKAAEEVVASGGVSERAVPRARIRVRQVISILVGTLGAEQAESRVMEALTQLGFGGAAILDEERAVIVLDHLARDPNLTAIARFAKVRLLMSTTRG